MSLYFNVWLNVLNAILIRDVKVRSGPYFSGYVFIFLMPFLHLFMVVLVYWIIQKVAPFGTDGFTYYGLSTLPFVIFVYPSRQIAVSIAANAPLLYFSRVKLVDIMFARGALEIVNGLLASGLILFVFKISSPDFNPENPFFLVYALLCTLIFGFSIGGLNALISQIFPMWMYVFGVFYPLFWILSGILFFPYSVPDPYISYLQYNPLLICVESIRYSYYFSYPDRFVQLDYVLWVSIIIFSISLAFERIGRRFLLGA